MFHSLTTADLSTLYDRQQKLHALSSEFDAFRLYAWQPLDQTEVAYWRNQYVLRFQTGGEACYIAPYETEDFSALLVELMAYERRAGGNALRFLSVERPISDFPPEFTPTPRRDLYDYLYRSEDLVNLQGRDYAAKRNQIAQFKRSYRWRFDPLTADNREDCLMIVHQWDATHEGAMLPYERLAIERMITFSQPLGQCGGILYADDQPAAFAIGSHPRDSLLDVIAEKALAQFTGVYSMIIHTYASYAYTLTPFQYINREEDMGLENLRNAKMQLKPERLIEKTLMTMSL